MSTSIRFLKPFGSKSSKFSIETRMGQNCCRQTCKQKHSCLRRFQIQKSRNKQTTMYNFSNQKQNACQFQFQFLKDFTRCFLIRLVFWSTFVPIGSFQRKTYSQSLLQLFKSQRKTFNNTSRLDRRGNLELFLKMERSISINTQIFHFINVNLLAHHLRSF